MYRRRCTGWKRTPTYQFLYPPHFMLDPVLEIPLSLWFVSLVLKVGCASYLSLLFLQSFLPDHLSNRSAVLGTAISFTKHSCDGHSLLTIYLTHLLYGAVRKCICTQGDASSFLRAYLSCHKIFKSCILRSVHCTFILSAVQVSQIGDDSTSICHVFSSHFLSTCYYFGNPGGIPSSFGRTETG